MAKPIPHTLLCELPNGAKISEQCSSHSQAVKATRVLVAEWRDAPNKYRRTAKKHFALAEVTRYNERVCDPKYPRWVLKEKGKEVGRISFWPTENGNDYEDA